MKTFITIALLLLSINFSVSQEIPESFKIYKTKVKLIDENKSVKGVFYAFNDSSINYRYEK